MNNNILVQYQGGGYSGCIWEWNYFYIDKAGTFHDIFSSGQGGIKDKSGLYVLNLSDDDVYVYDMTDKEDIETFNRECNVVNITGVLQWFEDNPQEDVEFFAVCSVCGQYIESCSEIHLEEWHGCGGIATTANKLICNECYCSGECLCCESYVGDTEIVKVNPNEHHGFDYICKSCKEYHDEGRASLIFEDLRHKSFCTGKPDMFSGELRERRLQSGGCFDEIY